MEQERSITQQCIDLASEIVDDIELSRLPADKLVYKAYRLAKILKDEIKCKWLSFEIHGYLYPGDDPEALAWADAVGRITDYEKKLGYWGCIGEIQSLIDIYEQDLSSLRIPDINFSLSSSNPNEYVMGLISRTQVPSLDPLLIRRGTIMRNLETYKTITARVLGSIHRYASDVLHQLLFSKIPERVFETLKLQIDKRLSDKFRDINEKLPSIFERLAAGDKEAISQAMNTCRRLFMSFADSIFPPRQEMYRLPNGEEMDVGTDKYKNRILAAIFDNCASDHLRKYLKSQLLDLHDIITQGVHSDLTTNAAQFAVINSYLLLGQIVLLLPEPPPLRTQNLPN